MTVPYTPGGAPQASAAPRHPAFAPRSLSTAGDPGGPPFVPRSQATAGGPDRPDHVPRSLASAGAGERPGFVAPALSSALSPTGQPDQHGFVAPSFSSGQEPERPAFVAPPLSHPAAQPGNYGLPAIAPNLFGGAPRSAEHPPETNPRNRRLFRVALWTAVTGLVLAGVSVLGVRLFLMASGMSVVPELTTAEAAARCEDALTNEVNRGLQAALIADRRIKSNLLTGVEVGEPKAVDGGFDVDGTGRFTVATGKKKAKPGKVLLTCMVRRDGAGQIVTTVTTKAKKG
ncbi:hypothetical protein [Actinoplanes derwentensis]|uniref:Uncharacterized protein n=1 Tax=Actinoplanes derwentensis TaxID=113562 RepID=A0A1H2BE54_9ACTN|nr:hypothetical protein [Actinoplanes derwentensis]GID89315.1 hypothetical protein Ade03nite_82390 [Actinoplanes derwentensis]SDT56545.1 hypothetical protein SAMN04489716_4548 [Actinoplanes derwentensis]